ncbi:hypothetical protein L1987_38313 [Smallanthus sonchifolius]|uniref:Uncharacterized protein n=1 Tax=Smallanthus sonchifolius TaxID=185202 RepID=A0ACB9HK74_9ASTR|nr:hypothetical protein L1987_38313 [Smallanthus sonchifolius]
MSGRRGGRNAGRGSINLTPAELTAMINERVAEALAANPNGGQNNHQQACTYKTFMDCKPHTFSGAEGAVGLLRWMEKTESVFAMCNCPQANQVKFASGTLEGPALTWWNAQVQMLTLEMANALPWNEFKTMLTEEYCPRDEVQKLEVEFWNLKMEGSEIEAYTTRSHELATLCPQMVTPVYKRIERFIEGLVPQIQSMVTSSNPTTIQQTIRLAHRLTDQAVAQGTLPPRRALSKLADNKRKFESPHFKSSQSNPPQQQHHQQRKFEPAKSHSQSNSAQQNQGSYAGKYPKCNKCNFHHTGACDRYRCQRCGKMGHSAKDCRGDLQAKQAPTGEAPKGCFECGKEGHYKRDCPQLKKAGNGNGNGNHQGGNGNGNGNGAKGRAFVIGSSEARKDQNVVTGMFPLNDHFASVLFDTGADRSFISENFSKHLELTKTPLEHKYSIEIADGKLIEATHILEGCKLGLSGHKLDIDLMPVTLGSFDIIVLLNITSLRSILTV